MDRLRMVFFIIGGVLMLAGYLLKQHPEFESMGTIAFCLGFGFIFGGFSPRSRH